MNPNAENAPAAVVRGVTLEFFLVLAYLVLKFPLCPMEMTIFIPDELAAKLRERAVARGQTVPAYAASLVVESVIRPTIDELLAPVQADFEKTGMTEEEFTDFLRGELEAHRREKRAKSM